MCWTIWTTRNKKIFENRSISLEETLSKAIGLGREWQEAQENEHKSEENQTRLQIQPTRQFVGDEIVVFTDAAWKESSHTVGLRWMFTDQADDNILISDSKVEEFVSSPLQAEGLAIREAIIQARRLGYNKLIVKSDAQTLVRAIDGRDSFKELFGIIHDIQNLSFEFSVISFVYISRSHNSAADSLAKGALNAFVSAV